MNVTTRTLAAFGLGVCLGVGVTAAIGLSIAASRPPYVITQDVVLDPKTHAVAGVLKPGTRFRVVGQKADISFIELNTAVRANELLGRAKCEHPCEGTPWDRWEAFRQRSAGPSHQPSPSTNQ